MFTWFSWCRILSYFNMDSEKHTMYLAGVKQPYWCVFKISSWNNSFIDSFHGYNYTEYLSGLKTLWDLPFFPSIAKLIPGSLSLMNGGQPRAESPFLASSKFFAQILPWAMFFSSCRDATWTKRVDIIIFWFMTVPQPRCRYASILLFFMFWEFNHAVPLSILIYFVSLILHILTRKFSTDASCLAMSSFQLTDTDFSLFK